MLEAKATEELLPILKKACERYPKHASLPAVIIRVDEQALYLFVEGAFTQRYPVSTSRHGVGQIEGSFQTPVGIHCVKEKIGEKAEYGEVFLSRKQTNSIASIESKPVCTNIDCITSRIIWLTGLEDGVNKAENSSGQTVDSYQRYIYIHGTHEEGLIGQAASVGCIRMKNADVIDLFNKLLVSSLVIIDN